MIDKKNYPITVLEDIEAVLKYFYSVEYKFQDIVNMKFNESHIIEIKFIENPQFRFVVTTPGQDSSKKTSFNLTKFPKNVTTNEESTFTVETDDVKNHFNTWIGLLGRYNSITLSKEQFYFKEEEKQFYEEFEIINEDSDTKPLPIESQFTVYKLLEDLQQRLKQHSESNPEVDEIIIDTELLKNNIQHLPQSVVAKGVAKVKVKIKKIGIKFFLDVVDVAYKEAIKFALKGGVDGIHQMLL